MLGETHGSLAASNRQSWLLLIANRTPTLATGALRPTSGEVVGGIFEPRNGKGAIPDLAPSSRTDSNQPSYQASVFYLVLNPSGSMVSNKSDGPTIEAFNERPATRFAG